VAHAHNPATLRERSGGHKFSHYALCLEIPSLLLLKYLYKMRPYYVTTWL
jgi:hypothetical protein